MAMKFYSILLNTYRILKKNSQEFRSKASTSMIFYALFAMYKRLNVYLFLIQKFLIFFLGFYKAIEIFGDFLRIIHRIISPNCIFYSI